jgi:putative membrane protein
MKIIEKTLWIVFYFLLFIIFIKLIGDLIGIQIGEKYPWFKLLFLGLPVILLLLHSILTLSFARATFFILLASITGLVMEYIGLRDGTIFGGHYIYKPQLTMFNVPVSVIFYWAVFIYTGYCLVNSFFYWLKLKKPNHQSGIFWLMLLAIFLDGLVVVAIDLFMDPIAVRSGSWKWVEGGSYFGVPVGNFIGWFLVTIIVTGIFRSWEYFFPEKEKKYDKSVFIIPVLGYGSMSLSYTFMAIKFQMYDLAMLGSLFMLPQIILNLFLFKKYKLK